MAERHRTRPEVGILSQMPQRVGSAGDYSKLDNPTLATLLKTFSEIPMDVEGDMFGQVYDYFLGKFVMAEGQSGGEFFTPTSLVGLIVEVIELYKGRIFDPACGSGVMFVQSADFVSSDQ